MKQKQSMSRVSLAIIVAVLLLIGTLIGLSCLTIPSPVSDKSLGFSAVHAAHWIEVIAKEPHSVFDRDSHKAVRQYLVNELEELGVSVSTKDYAIDFDFDGKDRELNITNIHGLYDGKSDEAVLMVTHYDSAADWDPLTWEPLPGVSYGAADAGYGIATILEVLRSIKQNNKPLENDIQILITDAEELGLIGAEEELSKNRGAFKNVRLVINLEARGVKGPAVMFETGFLNSSVMRYYIQNASNPFSYSFATDIYRLMPNGTDFTHFIRNGFSGYNFAVLDSLDYYHTEKDNLQNISLSSIQHYGNQVYPLVEQFVYTPSEKLPDFKSDSNHIFYNIFSGIIIGYPQSFSVILLSLLTLAFLLSLFLYIKRKQLRYKTFFASILVLPLSFVLFGLLGTATAYLTAHIHNRRFILVYLPRIPHSDLILGGVLTVSAMSFILIVRRLMRKKPSGPEAVLAGVFLNIALSILTCIMLPGASFLFIIPALFTIIYLTASLNKSPIIKIAAYALVCFIIPILFIPLTYMFSLALTLGSAGVITVFLLIALSTLVPVTLHFIRSNKGEAEIIEETKDALLAV